MHEAKLLHRPKHAIGLDLIPSPHKRSLLGDGGGVLFKQLIEVKAKDADALAAHVTGYDASSAPGLDRVTIYRDSDRVGIFFIEAAFSSREEAERNNVRAETDRWARRLRELVEEESYYCNLEPLGKLAGNGKGR